MGGKRQDMTNQRVGRWTVLSRCETAKKKWNCVCDCGTVRVVDGWQLRHGQSWSCGCYKVERTKVCNRTHGGTAEKLPEYHVWQAMKRRCYAPASLHYDRYGGRGITVCDRWKDSFANFLADMGHRPGPEYSIDRRDNDGNYEPGNCRWVTLDVQANNKRNNRVLEHNGERRTLAQWSAATGIKKGTLHSRLKKGWDIARLLEPPVTGSGCRRTPKPDGPSSPG